MDRVFYWYMLHYAMISVQNISKKYDEKEVLKGITLEIPKSKTVSLIGPSGCGKSTLLRIIMGLIPRDSGTVLIDGKELKDSNKLELRRRMGYVVQKGGLFPHLTAKENISLVTHYLEWEKAKINSRIEELLRLVRIDPVLLSKKPGNISGGQAQRISLMRALMLDPDIILLDEPLGSIDPLVRHELQSDLKEIFKTLNKTVLLVTHDLGEAAYLGDEIVLMREGEVAQQGAIHQILQNPASEFVQKFVSAQRSPLEGIK